MNFVYDLDENSHLNSYVVHQSLIGLTADDSREFSAKAFAPTRCGS